MATAAEVIAGTAAWGVDCSDALAGLRGLPDGCVQCCLTSPPFFSLRDYGTATWEGGSPGCDHKDRPRRRDGGRRDHRGVPFGPTSGTAEAQFRAVCGKCGARRVDRQIGLEADPASYVARLVEVFREVRRILHPTGLLLINLGDSFAGGGGGNYTKGVRNNSGQNVTNVRNRPDWLEGAGVKAKDLLGIPWLVAFALRADGWYLRCAPPWVKDNCMPESVSDRLTTAHEYWFLLAKSARYFWDADAVRVPHSAAGIARQNRGRPHQWGHVIEANSHVERRTFEDARSYGGPEDLNPAGRNLRTSDVFYQSLDDLIEGERAWLAHLEHVRANGGMLLDREGDPLALCYPTFAFPGSHFATFSPHMITPLLKAATSERGCCPACRAPWVRIVERTRGPVAEAFTPKIAAKVAAGLHSPKTGLANPGWRKEPRASTSTVGWQPSCACPPADPVSCLCIDPFCGSGTVGLVARRLGRRFVGFDLNEQYVSMSRKRIAEDNPLFNGAAPAPAPVPERTLFDAPAPKED
jgi:hypothetical protein